MTDPLPVLGWLVFSLAAVALAWAFAGRAWISGGVFGRRITDRDATRRLRAMAFGVAVSLGYLAGFLLGWWR